MRRLYLFAALAGTAFALAPAGATPVPFAGEVRVATTTFELGGRDGRTWLVGLTLDELRPLTGGLTRTLTLSLRPCSVDAKKQVRCADPVTYRAPVEAGGIAGDLRSAYVRTRVAGAPVDLSWSVTMTVNAAIANISTDEVDVRHTATGGSGPVAGVVLGPRCSTDGQVGGGYVVRRSGPPVPAATDTPATLPSALSATSRWRPRCV